MKKLTAVVLSLALLAANLAGCSDRNDSESSESKVTETTTTTTTSESKEDTSSENGTTTEETTTTSKEEDSSSDESTTTTTSVTDSSTTSNSTTTASTKANDTTTKAATTTKVTTAATTQTSTNPKSSNRVVLNVKNIQQKPELPKGSEITAATIALNYSGFNVNKLELLKYVHMADLPQNGKGYDPWGAYIGNPKLSTGYGCYNPVIKFAIRDYFRSKGISNAGTQTLNNDFIDLYKEIDNGTPVIIWATVNMKDVGNIVTWTDTEGASVIWKSNEHCLVLIGYDKDKDTAIFSDSLDPKGTVEYPRSVAEKAYNAMDKQSLVIRKE